MLIDVQASGQYTGLVAGIPHRPAGRDGADRSRQGRTGAARMIAAVVLAVMMAQSLDIKGCGFRYFVPRYEWYELVNHSASWTVWKWAAVPAHIHPTTKRLRGR